MDREDFSELNFRLLITAGTKRNQAVFEETDNGRCELGHLRKMDSTIETVTKVAFRHINWRFMFEEIGRESRAASI